VPVGCGAGELGDAKSGRIITAKLHSPRVSHRPGTILLRSPAPRCKRVPLRILFRRGLHLDADTAIGGPSGRFPSTRVSLLDAAASGLSDAAMDQVIALYWKPVYRFIRLKFQRSNEDAKDLTQGFFASALQRDFFARFDPAKASFRTYLRMAVERYAANEYAADHRQKRGGGVEFEPADEQRIATESPEAAFEREWRRQLFSLALDDLRVHCHEKGKQLHFNIFEDYDLTDGDRLSYSDMAAKYSIAETTVTNHLAWARRTLRSLITERLRATTSGAKELQEEMRRLCK
jgi:RNA polymerase sigma factor (sigma-70 family)